MRANTESDPNGSPSDPPKDRKGRNILASTGTQPIKLGVSPYSSLLSVCPLKPSPTVLPRSRAADPPGWDPIKFRNRTPTCEIRCIEPCQASAPTPNVTPITTRAHRIRVVSPARPVPAPQRHAVRRGPGRDRFQSNAATRFQTTARRKRRPTAQPIAFHLGAAQHRASKQIVSQICRCTSP